MWYNWPAMVVSAGLGAPLALVGCVLIPLLPSLLLLHQCGHLKSPDVKRRLAFLYCSYRSVPADPCLLCTVTCCMYYTISCSHLPGTASQDSCWKCVHIVINISECGPQHGCINCVATIMYA